MTCTNRFPLILLVVVAILAVPAYSEQSSSEVEPDEWNRLYEMMKALKSETQHSIHAAFHASDHDSLLLMNGKAQEINTDLLGAYLNNQISQVDAAVDGLLETYSQEIPAFEERIENTTRALDNMNTTCPRGWSELTPSKCIREYWKAPLDYFQAQYDCSIYLTNGKLVEIENQLENMQVREMMFGQGPYWIGGLYNYVGDKFGVRFKDGRRATYTRWGKGQPNLRTSCIRQGKYTDDKWEDILCTDTAWETKYMCQADRVHKRDFIQPWHKT